MSGQLEAVHPVPDDLSEYVSGRLPLDKETEMDVHFSECAQCADEVRLCRLLKFVAESWTAETHRLAYGSAAVARALTSISDSSAHVEWRGRLARWRDRTTSGVEVAIRVILNKAQSSFLDIEGFGLLTNPGSEWKFAPVLQTSGPLTRGPQENLAPPTVAVAPGPGTCGVRVEVLESERSVVVQIDRPQEGWSAPLVLLASAAGSAQPKLAEFRRSPGGGGLTARFDDVPIGDYILSFEP